MDNSLEKEKMEETKLIYAETNIISNLLSNISVLQGFPKPFEQEFQRIFFKKLHNPLRLTLFFGLILYCAFGIMEIFTFANWQLLVSIRVFLCGPVLLLILAFCFTDLYTRFHQTLAVIFAMIIITGLVTSAIFVPTHYKDLYYQSLDLVIFFLALLTALQFRYTVFLCIYVLTAFNISFYFSGMDKTQYYFWDLITNNYLIFGAAIMCAAVSYLNEINLRNDFLLNRLLNFKNKLLEYISRTDNVTGLGNRHKLDEVLMSEWNRGLRYHYPLAVLFIDFDYFKQYNDTYGHQAGDKALNSVGLVFSTRVKRAGDYVGRYGGDEFLVILSNTNVNDAIEIAKNIMNGIHQLSIEHKASPISNIITVTIGIAVMTPTVKYSKDILIKQADLALQKGKISSRNNIYLYDEHEIKLVESSKVDALIS